MAKLPLGPSGDRAQRGSVPPADVGARARAKRPDGERARDDGGDARDPEWDVDARDTDRPPENQSQQLNAREEREEESGDQSVAAHSKPPPQRSSRPRCSFRYRVRSANRCREVFRPSQMQCVRFGYSIIVNGLFAATSALIRTSEFW